MKDSIKELILNYGLVFTFYHDNMTLVLKGTPMISLKRKELKYLSTVIILFCFKILLNIVVLKIIQKYTITILI